MNLKQLLNQGKIEHHNTSKKEIKDLYLLVDRDIKDAKIEELSVDRRFATAYNAALQLSTVILYCTGYRAHGFGHHYTVLEAAKGIMGKKYYTLFDYFDSCRAKRNRTDYDYAGSISRAEAEELIREVEKFLQTVKDWVKSNYSKLT